MLDTNTALGFGGRNDPVPTIMQTESWNGTNWTNENDLNEVKNNLGGAGSQNSALGFGGNPGAKASTEEWNGTGFLTRTITSTTE
jgi:hypothetical protein